MRRDPLAGHPLGLGYLFASHPIFEDVLVPPDAPAPGTADGSTSNIGSGTTLGGTSVGYRGHQPGGRHGCYGRTRCSPRHGRARDRIVVRVLHGGHECGGITE